MGDECVSLETLWGALGRLALRDAAPQVARLLSEPARRADMVMQGGVKVCAARIRIAPLPSSPIVANPTSSSDTPVPLAATRRISSQWQMGRACRHPCGDRRLACHRCRGATRVCAGWWAFDARIQSHSSGWDRAQRCRGGCMGNCAYLLHPGSRERAD